VRTKIFWKKMREDEAPIVDGGGGEHADFLGELVEHVATRAEEGKAGERVVAFGLDFEDVVVDFTDGVAVGDVCADVIDLEERTEDAVGAATNGGAEEGGKGNFLERRVLKNVETGAGAEGSVERRFFSRNKKSPV
jgi:GTPase involved in cell partitioning and DNA repair